MKGTNLLLTALLILGAAMGYLYYEGRIGANGDKKITEEAIEECEYNIERLREISALAGETGSEEEAMDKAQQETKLQLRARAINDLVRAGVSGKRREILEKLSDDIDQYNFQLAYIFYISSNGSVSRPANPPKTHEVIRAVEAAQKELAAGE